MSFIISSDNQLIAKVSEVLKSGTQVRFSAHTCAEAIDANREFNLVNAAWGKISNAKKWEKVYMNSYAGIATMINEGDYII